MSLPQNYLRAFSFQQVNKFTALRFKSIVKLACGFLFLVGVFCAVPQLYAARAAARQYGWAKTSTALLATQIQRGKNLLKRASGGTFFAAAKAFAPNVSLTKTLVPGSPTALPTGRTFSYRLSWRCAGSISPADDCFNMSITDVLPAQMEFVPPAVFSAPVSSITTSGSNPQTVTIAFNPTVTAGSTGEVEIAVRYRPGTTPNGLTSANTATITAAVFGGGTATNNSNPVNTTAVATNKVSTEKVLVYGGAAGDLAAYDINVCNDPGSTPEGYLAFSQVTVSAPLPANAQFVAASPAPDAAPAVGANGTVSWIFPTGFTEPCRSFRVVVRYPSASFAVGNLVTNTAGVTGTLADGTVINDPAPSPVTLAAPAPDSNINKTAASTDKSAPDQTVGGGVTYNISVSNNGNVTQNMAVTDVVPNEIDLTRINAGGADLVEYQVSGGASWNTAGGAAPFNTILVSSLGLGAGQYVSNVRLTYNNVPPGTGGGRSFQLLGTIINPMHGGGAAYALPHTYNNTATVNTIYNGSSVGTKSATAPFTVIDSLTTRIYPQARKAVIAGNTASPNSIVRFSVGVRNVNATSATAFTNPVLTDLLESNLEYIPGSATITQDGGTTNCTGPAGNPQLVPNYSGTRSLLVWDWTSAAPACTVPAGGEINIEFEARVKRAANAGSFDNESAITNLIQPGGSTLVTRYCGSGDDPYTAGAIAGTGAAVNATYLCKSNPAGYSVLTSAQAESRKGVDGQLKNDGNADNDSFIYSGTTNVASTIRGGAMTWAMEIDNPGNVPFTNIDVIDILPFDLPAPGNVGAGTNAPLNSAWRPIFTSPIALASAPVGTRVYYTSTANPCRPGLGITSGCTPMTTNPTGVTETGAGQWTDVFPANPTTIRAFRLVFGSYVLAAGNTLRFEWPMAAPDDAPFAANGDDGLPATIDDTNVAWNTFAYSADRTDNGSTLASAPTRVGIEVRGTPVELASYGNYVWLDANRDGLQNEPALNGLNGVRVELYRDEDGDSNPLTGTQSFIGAKVTANNSGGQPGYYLFPGLTTGKYYAKFYAPADYPLASTANVNANANDTTDADGLLTTGVIYQSHVTMLTATAPRSGTPGQSYIDTDQGFYNYTVSAGNTVWFDTNNNGQIEATELGKDGVLVELFRDANNSGALEDMSALGGINELAPTARQLTSAGGYYLFTQRTDNAGIGNGLQLIPGQYFVGVAPANFIAAGAPATIGGAPFMAGMLAGYKSSNTALSNAGVISDAAVAFNGATNSNADNADDGLWQSAGFYQHGVLSSLLVLESASIEPANETTQPAGLSGGATPGHLNTVDGTAPGQAIADADSNLTVDFGFYNQYLGNLVFADSGAGASYNNGRRDAGEPGLGAVNVQLFAANGTTQINVGPDGILGTADDAPGGINTSSVPATLGQYQFCGLPQGQYVVKVTAAVGQFSSADRATTATPETNTDDDDNGTGIGTGMIFSALNAAALTLTPNNETAVDNATATTTNLTVDFGLMMPPVSLGNTVWFDTNNDGIIQNTEAGINGVKVELFLDADNSGTLAGAEQTPVATQTTSGGGYYLFTQYTNAAGVGAGVPLTAGKYFVGIAPMNFTAGMPLAGYHSSATTISNAGAITDATVAANTDLDGDNSDDGSRQTAGFYANGVLSGALMVMPTSELANETTQPAGATGGATPGHLNTIDGTAGTQAINDADSNASVDFGFYTAKLGDLVFSDDGGGSAANYDNALRNPGESGLAGVTVKLFAANGTTEINVGPDGKLGTADDTAGGVLTGSGANLGKYEFCNLPAGQYRVEIGVLPGYRSSTDIAATATPDDNLNDNDNGVTAGTGPTVMSAAISLTPGAPGLTNANTVTPAAGLTLNPTLDFGLTPRGLSLGNTVWLDANNNGAIDAQEKGQNGVRVELFYDADGNNTLTGTEQTPVAVQDTSAGGYYLFTQGTNSAGTGNGNPILPGKYFVGVAPANFVGTGALVGYQSSGTSINGTGVIAEAPIVGNQLSDNDQDNFDDGLKQTAAAAFYARGVLSNQIMLQPSTEPVAEITAGMPGAVSGSTPGHPNTLDGTAGGALILDNNSNITVDFGFYTQKLGDLVFSDVSTPANTNNGQQDLPAETGVAGAVLKLFAADGITEIPVGPDGILGNADDTTGGTNTLTTQANGSYQFCGLPQGQYVVKMTPPAGYVSSKDPATTALPGNNLNLDDNGIGNGAMALSATGANALTLTPGANGSANNNNVTVNTATTADPTLDFGVYPAVSLGNQVFYDADNNSTRNGGELGINGVMVELFYDNDMNGAPDSAFPLARVTTATAAGAQGLYLFTQQTLDPTTGNALGTPVFLTPGKYVICLPASNFTGTEALVNLYSSATSAGSTGATSESNPADPNTGGPAGNPGVDSDDSGLRAASGTVSSRTIDAGTNEPLAETPDNDPTTADGNENLTIDFGFYGLSLGNLVFADNGTGSAYNNALFDGAGGETGIPGVTVRLLAEDGVTLLQTKATDANGKYLFNNLAAGKYFVEVDRSAAVLTGLTSSRDIASSATPNNADSDDNGVTLSATAVRSPQVMLVANDTTATGENDQTQSAAPGFGSPVMTDNPNTVDANSNLKIDFGFVRIYTLGNRVWKDVDYSGTLNAADGTNPGTDGVTVRLLDALTGLRASDINGLIIPDAVTANGGYYRFDSLPRGEYIVEILASNFTTPANPLFACVSSPLDGGDPDTDTDDGDDNGVGVYPNTATGIRSLPVSLGEGSGTAEPTNDSDPATNPQTGEAPNNQSDRTLDFGFSRIYSLGNRIWKDIDNSGTINTVDGTAPGLNNVSLRLLSAGALTRAKFVDGTDVPDILSAGGGYYRFDNLRSGDYVVEVLASNFTTGNVLNGCVTSTGLPGVIGTGTGPNEPAPDADANPADNDDNGAQAGAAVRSQPVTLGEGTMSAEPTNDNDPATNPLAGEAPNNQSNRTVDFGFTNTMNLGNLVWKDYDNDGTRDLANPNEPAVGNVKVVLYGDTNANGTFEPATDLMLAMTNTLANGSYAFNNLLPGGYFAVVDQSNFTGTGALAGCLSSTYHVTGNSDTNHQDHGVDNPTPASGGVASSLVTLIGGQEPSNDEDSVNGNLTIDFGFIPTNLVIGNLIWKDADFNGSRNGNETGIGGVKVNLYRDVNRNGTYEPATDTLVATQTTNTNGGYAFTGLIPDPYFAQVDPGNFATDGALFGCASSNATVTGNSDLNEQDHGSTNSDPFNYPPISSVITMVDFNEPNSTDGDDANGNLTVDFGFVTVALATIDDMGMCVGAGATLTLTTRVSNPGVTAQANNPGPEFAATFPAGLVGVPGTGVSNGGGTITVTRTGVTWDGTIPANGMVTLSYRVQAGNTVQSGTNLCVTSTVYADGDNNGTNEGVMSTSVCHVVNCPAPGPGIIPSEGSGSSVLIFPLYSSSAANPADNNTRISITNYHAAKAVSLHLFYIDGASCTVADAALCLTAQQTSSFLMSDIDPGTTGYLMAVAVDGTGCPINFNFLGGDAFIKFDSGHRGNLSAYGVPAMAGGLAACDQSTNNVALNFDGVSYGMLPRTVAVNNIASPADGNRMMLFINRIGGNLTSGAEQLSSIFGLLYDDTEKAYSFSFTPNTCQFRSELSGSFPRTTPRLSGVIPTGRSGWMKLFAQGDAALVGGTLNYNSNSISQTNAFNGGHNLHTLTLTGAASVTIPVFPPHCN